MFISQVEIFKEYTPNLGVRTVPKEEKVTTTARYAEAFNFPFTRQPNPERVRESAHKIVVEQNHPDFFGYWLDKDESQFDWWSLVRQLLNDYLIWKAIQRFQP